MTKKATSFLLVSILFLDSCDSGKSTTKTKNSLDGQRTIPEAQITKTVMTGDTGDIFHYGQLIIDNKVNPNLDERSWICLDSLSSKNKNTRQFFFMVYKALSHKSDGALSEGIGGRIKNYFYEYPTECVLNYRQLTEQERESFNGSIAFEFYASSADYKKDIESYIKNIQDNLTSAEDKDLMNEIKQKILRLTKEMYD